MDSNWVVAVKSARGLSWLAAVILQEEREQAGMVSVLLKMKL